MKECCKKEISDLFEYFDKHKGNCFSADLVSPEDVFVFRSHYEKLKQTYIPPEKLKEAEE